MKIAISTESTCDLPRDLLDKYKLESIAYSIIIGDDIVEDNENVPAQIFEFVEKTKKLPQTSAINEEQYKEYFKSLLEKYDEVVHISLSSGLTSSTAHAMSAAENLKKVHVIDSKSLSTGLALLCIYARELADKDETAESIVEKVNARISAVQASFIVENLDYLCKGGRCSKLALFGANLLKIRPQIVVKDGFMSPAKKYRGKIEKVIKDYCADTLAEFNTPDKKVAFITHTTATPEMIENARVALEEAGFKEIYDTTAGGTVTAHCGEHVLGILYLNDGE